MGWRGVLAPWTPDLVGIERRWIGRVGRRDELTDLRAVWGWRGEEGERGAPDASWASSH